MSDDPGKLPEGTVPYLSMTFINQNPNHKFLLPSDDRESERFIYVADLGFVQKDDSVYVVPHLTREYTLRAQDARSGEPVTLAMRPGQGVHMSLDESGAINMEHVGRADERCA